MIYEHSNYREYLRDTLIGQIRKNPRFSLRAFAKRVGLAPSNLSEVIRGKKNLSEKSAIQVAERMGLNPVETEYFVLLVQLEGRRDDKSRQLILDRLQRLNPSREVNHLGLDVFNAISDWYHVAVITLTRVEGFVVSPESAAQALGVTLVEASAAIDRLVRLNLIEKTKAGYRKTGNYLLAHSDSPDEGLRNYHRQMLSKAIDSLTAQTPREKVIGSENLVIDEDQIEEARQITERYFAEMIKLSERAEKKTHAYHLGVQFFNLMKTVGGKNENDS
jgi:uncharacterized protein (TIGR02147 family)